MGYSLKCRKFKINWIDITASCDAYLYYFIEQFIISLLDISRRDEINKSSPIRQIKFMIKMQINWCQVLLEIISFLSDVSICVSVCIKFMLFIV